MMRYISLLILPVLDLVSCLFVYARGDRSEPLKFQCPRAFELYEDRFEGCIYKGNFIKEIRCLELCQNHFRSIGLEFKTKAFCIDNQECECRIPSATNTNSNSGLIISLIELEEDQALEDSQLMRGTGEVKCGYYNVLITANKCQELCTNLQKTRGTIQDPSTICQMHLRCKCEEAVEDGYSSFVDLDTLEAQYDYKVAKNRAANVRHWLQVHNGVNDLERRYPTRQLFE